VERVVDPQDGAQAQAPDPLPPVVPGRPPRLSPLPLAGSYTPTPMATGDLDSETRAAKKAVVLLVCNGALSLAIALAWLVTLVLAVAGVPSTALAHAMNGFLTATGVATWVLLIAGAAFFCTWISSAFGAAKALGAKTGRYDAHYTNVGFFIPLLNLVQPYRGLRALDGAIDPTLLPEPPPRPAGTDGTHGYRDAASAQRPSADIRPAPLVAWWGLWLGRVVPGVLAIAAYGSWVGTAAFAILGALTDVACLWMAILVVRRIDARLRERALRRSAAA
jgi:hypothetical protein